MKKERKIIIEKLKNEKDNIFTITKGNATEIEEIGINTSASKIMVKDRIIKGIMDDSSSPIIDDAFINNINENTEITAIPEKFSYSEN